ncbi:hypothetical protein [Rubritalea marina]|uniref:hypothetical protein n=1 Tax=Rubritalea marina TaxID=361055 RepID=UPI000371AD00|nr:hypothetical protein [Rubritalea marina]
MPDTAEKLTKQEAKPIMRTLLIIWTALLSITASAQELQVSISSERCTVGEPLILTATLRSPTLMETAFFIEEMPDIYLSNSTKNPVQMLGGHFCQSHAWTLQATRSGEIAIDGIFATLTRGPQTRTITAPPITVTVASPTTEQLSTELLTLPQDASPNTSLPLWISLCVGGIALLGVLLFKYQRQRVTPIPTATAPPTLSVLIEALKTGVIPRGTIQSLLQGNSLTATQRAVLESALYARDPQAYALLQQLQKEAQG